MSIRRKKNSITVSGEDLQDLKQALRDSILGAKKKKLRPGQVQCPFCGDVYMPQSREHFISGICDGCWPEEHGDDDEHKPF